VAMQSGSCVHIRTFLVVPWIWISSRIFHIQKFLISHNSKFPSPIHNFELEKMYVVNTKPHGLIIMNDQKKIKNNSSYIFPYLFPWSFRAFGKCTLFLGCNSLPMETTTLHLSFLILGSLALVVGDALNKPSFVTCFLMCFLFQSFWRCYDEL